MINGTGDVAGDVVAQKAGRLVNTRSKFDKLGYPFFTTNRFGEITPFFVMENLDGDHNNKLLSSSKVDSYTLKVPLMQDVKLKKEIFYVPRQAILPFNWEKFYTNPNIGDDVPDDCGTTVKAFWYKVYNYINTEYDAIRTAYFAAKMADPYDDYALRQIFPRFIQWLIVTESLFSDGNLLSQLGISGSKFLQVSYSASEDWHSFDWFFDLVFGHLAEFNAGAGARFTINSTDGIWVVSPNGVPSDDSEDWQLSYREFLDRCRDEVTWFSVVEQDEDSVGSDLDYEDFLDYVFGFTFRSFATETDHLDLARLWAYQLVCAHFYTNDHVDYVYSAALFREYIGDLVSSNLSASSGQYTQALQFTVNGMRYQYDYLSARFADCVISYLSGGNPDIRPASIADAIAYMQALFGFRHSLRFMDYFVSSRTRPLAVGDTDVAVNSNKASVIDITRSLMTQKFLNAVNRIGRKEKDYSHLMGGDGRKPDYHDPLWIGRTEDVIYGDRNEYTGTVEDAKRNNITSLLKNAGGKYMFSWEVDRPSICIGVCYYDIERVYTQLIERQAFHVNRFDMFNPYMQFIGDQPIYKSELMTGGTQNSAGTIAPFGYENRHMEYKLRVPRAVGGFVADSGLPSWIFSAERGFRKYESNQSPSFIRSFNSEFDQFYVNLTGYSLGTYFHFIVRHLNVCSSSRPMVAAPDILQ